MGLLEIKAKVIEIGVSFAWDIDTRDVVIESDSKVVVDTLLGLYSCLQYFDRFSSQLSGFSISSSLP